MNRKRYHLSLYLVLVFSIVVVLMSGCTTSRGYLPHIPKDVEVTGLEVQINSPWGGTTTVKAESYKSSGFTPEE